MNNLKKQSIIILTIIFLCFLAFEFKKDSNFKVLKIYSPTQIVIDLNQNGIEESNETITLNEIQTFSTKSDFNNQDLLKSLNMSASDGVKIGFLTEQFSKEFLLNKKITLNESKNKIFVNGKDYDQMLVEKGLAVCIKNKNNNKIHETLEIARKLNLTIFNNKSHKYHKLDCKYGQIAHNAIVLPTSQLPKDAKPCKFCHSGHHHNNYKNYKKYNYKLANDFIPNIKSPPTYLKTEDSEMFLTDMTKTLKPDNNCNTALCKTILREINSAQNSIDFAIYGYTKIPKLEQALKNAQNRNVRIRFVYDSDAKHQNIYPDTNYLSALFSQHNHDTNGKIMHNKFFIFDNKKVLTGSANISNTDMSGFNSNVAILINSEQAAQAYIDEFEQMYNGRFHKQKHKNNQSQSDNLKIYFSPKDQPLSENVIPLINQAQKYIYIPAFLITHKEMTNALINAAHRGVAVKIILDATNTHSGSHSKLKELRAARIPVKTENFAGKLHSKSIVIDDLFTVIGSMNFSKSGENFNDENLIIIKNPQIAIFYKTFFQYMWKRIPDKWLKYNARAESPDSIGSCSDGIDNDFDGKIDKADDSCKSPKKAYKKL